ALALPFTVLQVIFPVFGDSGSFWVSWRRPPSGQDVQTASGCGPALPTWKCAWLPPKSTPEILPNLPPVILSSRPNAVGGGNPRSAGAVANRGIRVTNVR